MFFLSRREQIPYGDYITSDTWRDRHPAWLKRTNNRCQLFPWVRVGRVKGKYFPYAIHHMHTKAYRRQGRERWNRDVIVLCPSAHNLVFHYLLSGGKKRVSHQKAFPNIFQRAVNWHCRLVGMFLLLPYASWFIAASLTMLVILKAHEVF